MKKIALLPLLVLLGCGTAAYVPGEDAIDTGSSSTSSITPTHSTDPNSITTTTEVVVITSTDKTTETVVSTSTDVKTSTAVSTLTDVISSTDVITSTSTSTDVITSTATIVDAGVDASNCQQQLESCISQCGGNHCGNQHCLTQCQETFNQCQGNCQH